LRGLRHWTPRYIFDRLAWMLYERRHPDSPWLHQAIVQILGCWLKPDDRGLEWGSGRSTIWFAQRVGFLPSIEHDPFWYSKICAELEKKGLRNVEYHLCPDEAEYRAVCDRFPPESLDFCLVDGLARDFCALSAVSLLKPGGILVVDNCNWYLPTDSRSPCSRRSKDGPLTDDWGLYMRTVVDWRYIWTSNGVFDTALWVKPLAAKAPTSQDNQVVQQSLAEVDPLAFARSGLTNRER
jgi:hypothetical protein